MKKLLAALLALLLLGIPALAEERVTIPLADGELSFVPFAGGCVLTKETSASVFNRVGLSQREIVPWMEEHNLYALMYDAPMGCEVQIEVLAVTQPDYNTITPEQDREMLKSFTDFYEQYGHTVEASGMYDNGSHRFGWVVVTQDYADGYVEHRIHYKTCHNDYMIEMVMFVYDSLQMEAYTRLARELVDSITYTLNADVTQLVAPGIRVQLVVPEGVTVHASADAAGVTLPEAPAGKVVGCMTDPAGEWFFIWQLDDRVTGDLDRVSDTAVKSLYQGRARNKKAAGCTVTLTEDHPDSRQRYIRIGYQFSDENGDIWYAEEYYTKQAGWGVSVTLYSAAPLAEDVQSLLETIVNSQMVTVEE